MNQAAALKAAIETLKTPASERKQEGIHLCAVLLTDHLRAMPTKLPYNLLCEACRAFVYAQLAPRVAFVDADDSGQLVLRVLLSGSVLVHACVERQRGHDCHGRRQHHRRQPHGQSPFPRQPALVTRERAERSEIK